MKTYCVLTFVGFLLIVSTTHAVIYRTDDARVRCGIQEVSLVFCRVTAENKDCDGNYFAKFDVEYALKPYTESRKSTITISVRKRTEPAYHDLLVFNSEVWCDSPPCIVEAGTVVSYSKLVDFKQFFKELIGDEEVMVMAEDEMGRMFCRMDPMNPQPWKLPNDELQL